MVDAAPWGVIVVLANEILHHDTETRLTDFTHLVASSISNVHARNNLIASRARVVTASDETRRRIERNLHDGIQQRVLAVGLDLRAVRAIPVDSPPGRGTTISIELPPRLADDRRAARALTPRPDLFYFRINRSTVGA